MPRRIILQRRDSVWQRFRVKYLKNYTKFPIPPEVKDKFPRYKYIYEKRIIKWERRLYVMGTYDANVRNLECHFSCPVRLDWNATRVSEAVKSVMRQFLKDSEYAIDVWDERNFGSERERARPGEYTRDECPSDFTLQVFDYDYNAKRAESIFEFDLYWINQLTELKKIMKFNLRVFRGKRTGRTTKLGEGQRRLR